MKKILLTLVACLTLFGAGHAQVSDMTVGYCDGQLPSKGDISFSESDAYVSAAIYIPAGTVNTYAGNSLTGVNAGLASKLNIDELTVWVRTSLDGENLAEATITKDTDPKLAKGWNKVMFAEPWAITAGNTTGLYIGYTYHQKGSCFGVAAIDTPCANGFFLKQGSGDWEDRSAQATASIEGFVRGDKLPTLNLSLLSVSTPDILIVEKQGVKVSGTVKNIATYDITGYDVNLVIGGQVRDTKHIDCSLAFNQSEKFEVMLNHGLSELLEGENTLTVLVNNVNGSDDIDMTDNSLDRTFTMVLHDYTKKIFVEEFTTEQCPNCPRVGNYIHDALEKSEFAENVLVVCHHSGYYTDWLTANFDDDYLWFFGPYGSYAPAVMIDRQILDDENTRPPYCPGSASEMEGNWRSALADPAFVSLNISAAYDEEDPNKLAVTVKGNRSKSDLCDNPVITVYLVEDNIAARAQAGSGGSYTHYHVNRLVNTMWGAPIEWDGDDYTYNCEFAISQMWVRENFSIVAVISNYNSQDYNDCLVMNANNLLAADFEGASSVEGIEAAEDVEAEYYTLTGVRAASTDLAPGIYLRKTGSKTTKVIIK